MAGYEVQGCKYYFQCQITMEKKQNQTKTNSQHTNKANNSSKPKDFLFPMIERKRDGDGIKKCCSARLCCDYFDLLKKFKI